MEDMNCQAKSHSTIPITDVRYRVWNKLRNEWEKQKAYLSPDGKNLDILLDDGTTYRTSDKVHSVDYLAGAIKNSIRVYTNDVISYQNNRKTFYGVVRRANKVYGEGYVFFLKPIHERKEQYSYERERVLKEVFINPLLKGRVVGNIHDNPELMEVEE